MALILNKSCLNNLYSFNVKNQAIDKKMTIITSTKIEDVFRLVKSIGLRVILKCLKKFQNVKN